MAKAINPNIEYLENEKFQCPAINIQDPAKISKASPIRFVRAVIIPAASDLSLW